jgi:hypothetical protein
MTLMIELNRSDDVFQLLKGMQLNKRIAVSLQDEKNLFN